MRLNDLKPASGSRTSSKRVGRGIGSGLGKTCGRGHKGQHSRSGGFHKVGFEGGQMPIQRRLPKVGFSSRVGRYYDQITLSELTSVAADTVSLKELIDAGLVRKDTKVVKVILSGEISKAVTVTGLRVTKGARQAIEGAGGKVEE
ncbi:MAG: 50S ribosomal protein L15 [Gammaproteobacteria bacterium]|nr:MAG: 50S ribosomal protein L15 [Gammaproteobacteria bacterium]